MNREQALCLVRSVLEDSQMMLYPTVVEAMKFLESEIQPIGYIEPGKIYVMQIKDYSETEVLEITIKMFHDLGCKVIVLGPGVEFLSPTKWPENDPMITDDDEPDWD